MFATCPQGMNERIFQDSGVWFHGKSPNSIVFVGYLVDGIPMNALRSAHRKKMAHRFGQHDELPAPSHPVPPPAASLRDAPRCDSLENCCDVWKFLQPTGLRKSRLILVPDSGWGDFTHAITTAFLTGAMNGFPTSVLVNQSWGCGFGSLTKHAASGKPWFVLEEQLEAQFPTWHAVKALLPLARYHSSTWFKRQGGRHWRIEDPKGCVGVISGWGGMAGHHITSQLNATRCRATLVTGANWHDTYALAQIAMRFRMRQADMRSCVLRYAVRFKQSVTSEADRLLLALSTSQQPKGSRRTVHVGIHVRAFRYLKSTGKVDAALYDDADLISSSSQTAWNASDFKVYADAARALQTWWQTRHEPEQRFQWLVFTDSEALRGELQRAWSPRASSISLGSPGHTHYSVDRDCNATYMEWLLFTKCDLLVVSSSGFSMSAATYSEQIEQVAAVFLSHKTGKASYALYAPNHIAKSMHPASFPG